MKRLARSIVFSLWPLLASNPVAQVPPTPTIPNLPDVNPEVLKLVIADQWDRGMDMFSGRQVKTPGDLDWNTIATRDQERQAKMRSLLATGQLTTASDYRFAALIFQHSPAAADLAVAHLLAMTAVAKGNNGARWLAAAAFDRHMQSLNQPQVFGTQFKKTEGGDWTMEPYDRAVLSDTVRAAWCVIPLAEQNRVLDAMRTGNGNASTSIADCK